MGSHFATEIFDGKLNSTELRRQYDRRLEELTDQHGHDAYNGTLTTTQGLKIEEKTFDSREAAEDYVSNNTDKWCEALAVKFKDVREEVAKQPTFDGKADKYGIFSAVENHTLRTVTCVYKDENRVPVAADQLTTSQKATAVALFSDYETKARAFNVLQKTVRDMLGRMEPSSSEPPTMAQLRELQTAIKQRLKARGIVKKAADKLVAFDIKHTPKIYATKKVDHGLQWLVGGWAAE